MNDPDPYQTPAEVSTAKGAILKSPWLWVTAAAVVVVVTVGLAMANRHVQEFGEFRGGPPQHDAYESEVAAYEQMLSEEAP